MSENMIPNPLLNPGTNTVIINAENITSPRCRLFLKP